MPRRLVGAPAASSHRAAGRSSSPTTAIPTPTTPPRSCSRCAGSRIRTRPGCGRRSTVAVAWTVGMQSRDGGWGAFDADNTRTLPNKLPFCDFGAVIDPPSADVTAHVVEMLAAEGTADEEPCRRGVAWLLRRAGAGRLVVRPLGRQPRLRHRRRRPGAGRRRRARRTPADPAAVRWLGDHQNADGGWGEDLRSYDDPRLGRPGRVDRFADRVGAARAACRRASDAAAVDAEGSRSSSAPSARTAAGTRTATPAPASPATSTSTTTSTGSSSRSGRSAATLGLGASAHDRSRGQHRRARAARRTWRVASTAGLHRPTRHGAGRSPQAAGARRPVADRSGTLGPAGRVAGWPAARPISGRATWSSRTRSGGDGERVPSHASPLLAGALRRAGLTVHHRADRDDPAGSSTRRLPAGRSPPAGALAVDTESALARRGRHRRSRSVTGRRRHRRTIRCCARARWPAGPRPCGRCVAPLPVDRRLGRRDRRREVLLAGPRSFCAGVERAIEIVERALERYGAAGVRPPADRAQPPRRARPGDGAARSSSTRSTRCPEGSVLGARRPRRRPAGPDRRARAPRPPGDRRHLPAGRQGAQRGAPLRGRGDTVFLIGHADHEEVEGTVGEAPGHVVVVARPGRGRAGRASPTRRGSPTSCRPRSPSTRPSEIGGRAAGALPRARRPAPRRHLLRHHEPPAGGARRRRRTADLVLVVGSANSSNSYRLVEVAAAEGVPAHLVDDAGDVDLPGWPACAGSASPPVRPRHLSWSTSWSAAWPASARSTVTRDSVAAEDIRFHPAQGGELTDGHAAAAERSGSARYLMKQKLLRRGEVPAAGRARAAVRLQPQVRRLRQDPAARRRCSSSGCRSSRRSPRSRRAARRWSPSPAASR